MPLPTCERCHNCRLNTCYGCDEPGRGPVPPARWSMPPARWNRPLTSRTLSRSIFSMSGTLHGRVVLLPSDQIFPPLQAPLIPSQYSLELSEGGHNHMSSANRAQANLVLPPIAYFDARSDRSDRKNND